MAAAILEVRATCCRSEGGKPASAWLGGSIIEGIVKEWSGEKHSGQQRQCAHRTCKSEWRIYLEDCCSSIHSLFTNQVQDTRLKSKFKGDNGRKIWKARKRPDHEKRVQFYFVGRGIIAELEQGK